MFVSNPLAYSSAISNDAQITSVERNVEDMNLLLREDAALTVAISTDANCIFIQRRGKFKAGEMINALRGAIEDPRYVRGMNVLLDLREIDHSGARYSQLMPQAEAWREIGTKITPCKIAVVHSSELNYGVGRQSSAVLAVDGIDRRPFRDLEKALEFLELPPDIELPF